MHVILERWSQLRLKRRLFQLVAPIVEPVDRLPLLRCAAVVVSHVLTYLPWRIVSEAIFEALS